MRVRMLESIGGHRPMQLPGGKIYLEPYAMNPGEEYELDPVRAQQLTSTGKAVTVEPVNPLGSVNGAAVSVLVAAPPAQRRPRGRK